MIRIEKASAGSGKTYGLAQFYLSLLKDKNAYRHILAVTFTNKATAEMKSRILKFLAKSPKKEHQEALSDILHDYSAFAVSTIDKFFQQALKAFAREIGQTADYQIELDKESLIKESMDRILDSLGEGDSELLSWLKKNVEDSLSNGERVDIDNALYDMGKELMKAQKRDIAEAHGIDHFHSLSKERLAAIIESCHAVIHNFTQKVNESAKDVVVKSTNAIKQLKPYLDGFQEWETIEAPSGKSLLKESVGTKFYDLFAGDEFRYYNTAKLICDLSFSLGLAGEFYRSFEALLKEKNVMSLDESNTILKDIIDGSDAPFVYEKMGVRYENFLLDEFQDTSTIQWENFLPLLKESHANHNKSLIVGDVKQSIYRWRNTEWNLLAHEVKQCFPDAEEESKTTNWRSCRTIVHFNNNFFKSVAGQLGFRDLYADVEQTVMSDDEQEGHVQLSFCTDTQAEIDRILESIASAREAGAKFDDIAILVRKNDDGEKVAASLIANGIPVISDDSLSLKSSRIVRKVVSLLSNHENPDDEINEYIAASDNVVFPSSFHSLLDLCEDLLRQLRAASPEDYDGETLYIQAFMDDLREWVDANGNELRYYLQHWRESDKKIGSPEDSNSVRIITIHKAKGLEFKYLIFPFADKVTFYHDQKRWCYLNVEGTPFAKEVEGIYPIKLSAKSSDTLFSDALKEEQQKQLVDNMNVFYVALTRAEKCLHIISKLPTKKFRVDGGEASAFTDLLYRYCGNMDEMSYGTDYDFRIMKREEKAELKELPYSYSSYPIGERLKVSSEAADFFGEDGSTGAAASARRNGIVLHSILSQVQVADELREAVDMAILDGQLSAAEGENAFKLLSSRIDTHPEWFSSRGLNEVGIFDIYGHEKRPDRVIIKDDEVTIIDYKFGEHSPESESIYRKQVAGYMQIFSSLGYNNVSGYVWYVIPDNLISL